MIDWSDWSITYLVFIDSHIIANTDVKYQTDILGNIYYTAEQMW